MPADLVQLPSAGIKMKIAGMSPPAGCFTYAPTARHFMEQFVFNKILRAVIKVILKLISVCFVLNSVFNYYSILNDVSS